MAGSTISCSSSGGHSEPIATIVTVVLNNAEQIESTIESVLRQTYGAVEYIIVDGGSKDGTLEIIRRYQDRLHWISEPDSGIYDAFNKGTKLASGKYIGFLNAGDQLSSPNHLHTAVNILENCPAAAFVYGDVTFYIGDKPIFTRKGSSRYHETIRYGMGALNHPSMLARHFLFDIIGPFENTYRISGDFNWLQRLHKAGYRGLYSSKLCVKMAMGGVSDRQSLSGLKENRISSIALGTNPLLCWMAYGSFAARYHARQCLERYLPSSWVIALRRLLNHTYSPATRALS